MSANNTTAQTQDLAVKKRGWHAKGGPPPRQGKGSATVSPLRDSADIARIKTALAKTPRDLSLFVCGIHFGLRAGDLLQLKWSDILVDGKLAPRLAVREEKTGNVRRIAIQEKARSILQVWLDAQSRPLILEGYVWPNRSGGSLTVQRLHQLMNAWCKSAKVHGHFGTHTLRKTYGYHLRQLGYDIELLMRIFGHSSASVTLRYIGIEQEEIDEANLSLSL